MKGTAERVHDQHRGQGSEHDKGCGDEKMKVES